MQRSDTRILTTHTGSLPRPASLVRLYIAKARGEPVDAQLAEAGHAALEDWVRKQRDAGIDIGNNGEQQREAFFLYVRTRMSGFGGAWTRPPRGDVERYPAFKAAIARDPANIAQVSSRDDVPTAIGDIRYSTAPRSTPNAPISAPRSTSSAIRSSNRSSPRRLPASSLPRCATTITRARKPTSQPSARRCASNTKPSSTTASCCSSIAPISRWSGTCPIKTNRWVISSASSIALSRPSTLRSPISRATASDCMHAGETMKARTTATWNCKRSCRSCAS